MMMMVVTRTENMIKFGRVSWDMREERYMPRGDGATRDLLLIRRETAGPGVVGVTQITWLHNDKPVKRSKDIEMLTDCGRCSLIIHEVYLEDSGDYVCEGRNEHGSAQTSCHLTVERT